MKIAKITTRPPERKDGRMHFFPSETLLQNLSDRFSRPYKEWKKLIPTVLQSTKTTVPKDLKISWSRLAGCSCGCSPGFILKGLPMDFYVDLK